jgi:amidohydrolase
MLHQRLEAIPWERLRAWRRKRHRHPECADEEGLTAAAFDEWTKACGAQRVLQGLGGHGVLASFDSGKAGPQWLFRAELDALPIEEGPTAEERPHRSQVAGKAHLCGHDGHLSILAGLASMLQSRPPSKGQIHLLAQPAEETGAGARRVLEDPAWPFQTTALQGASASESGLFPLDACFAIHNLPGIPLGQLWCPEGAATAAVCSLAMQWQGHTAHAAEPENGQNPAFALQGALSAARNMEQRDAQRSDFLLAVPIQAALGTDDQHRPPAYGTAAGKAALHLTFRAWTQRHLDAALQAYEEAAQKQASDLGLQLTIQRKESFAACRNDQQLCASIRSAAESLNMPRAASDVPFRWGEDFGLFTQRQAGALIGLGAGTDCPPLHHPDYDFPDKLMPIALGLYAQLLDTAGF